MCNPNQISECKFAVLQTNSNNAESEIFAFSGISNINATLYEPTPSTTVLFLFLPPSPASAKHPVLTHFQKMQFRYDAYANPIANNQMPLWGSAYVACITNFD